MNPVDNIIGKLESFISVFLSSKVRYEYDEKSRSHMIEVLPIEIYQQNDDYIEWESETFDEFISKYPSENICFISDDSLVKIDSPVFEKEGLYYTPFSVERKSIVFDMSSVQISRKLTKHNLLFTYNQSQPELNTIEETNIPVEYTNYSYLNAA